MRFSRAVLRVLAFVMLAALLIGAPVFVFRVIGAPLPRASELHEAWQQNHIDADFVVRIGVAIFAVLWLWFACTAIAEVWQVIAWRYARQDAGLSPLPPGPAGAVRALVRFIVVSSVSATATFGSFAPFAQASVAVPLTRPVVVASSTASLTSPSPGTLTMRAPTHLAVGRETPFSLAAMLGSAELRDAIIEMNLGRVSPDGMAWQGGVFPAGMEVSLPEEYAVRTPLGPAHEVVKGDSYWGIADDHLAVELSREATAHEVMEYTESLMSLNQQLLDHRDPALIIPGELVVFTSVGAVPTVDVVAHVAVAALPVVEAPVVEFPSGGHHVDLAVPDQILSAPVVVVAPAAQPVFESPATLRPSSIANATAEPDSPVSFAAGLGAAIMMSAGAIGLLESRRRQQLRSATIGARLQMPSTLQAQTEVLLRSLNAQERLARLDVALRSAAPSLAGQAAFVQAAVMYDTGDVCLFLRGSATPGLREWKADLLANTWRLSGAVSLTALAEHARQCAQPCPAMVHVGGVLEGGELFVDLEAVGVLVVESPHAADILRNIAASLSVSPFVEAARVFTVGLGEMALGSPNSESVDSFDAALDAAAMSLGSTGALARGASTFALRVSGAGGEAWEPSVVVALVDTDGRVLYGESLAALAGGRGLAVVVGSQEVVADGPAAADMVGASWVLRCTEGQHTLEPLGLSVQPAGVSVEDISALRGVLDAAPPLSNDEPLASPLHLSGVCGSGVEICDAAVSEASVLDVAPFLEPQWALMVSVLGPVQVISAKGVAADCERSKATELIVWLSQHRERPTRSAARTALWDLDVRDATFANVVSDARRALARAVAPAEGEEWIARTLTENLPLHAGVVTDAELLALRVAHARGLPSLDAIGVLRPGVELLLGLPFAGTSYLWTDAEGITSSLILLATGAAIELANHYLVLGDVDGVFWATGQGLKVLSGHEELIALRMRAHARRGDLAGVRGEWESYERALAADPWAAAEPAPKLVALRRELLTPKPHSSGGVT